MELDIISKKIYTAQKIPREHFFDHLGSCLDDVSQHNIFFEIQTGGSSAILMPFSAFQRIFSDDSSALKRVSSRVFKNAHANDEGSSHEVFTSVINNKKPRIFSRHGMDTAVLIEKSYALSLVESKPSDQNLNNFNQIVTKALQSGNDVEITLDPSGLITARIKRSDLEGLRKTIEQHNLTPKQAIEILESMPISPKND